jgi:hypothetical protein
VADGGGELGAGDATDGIGAPGLSDADCDGSVRVTRNTPAATRVPLTIAAVFRPVLLVVLTPTV